jgi:hypothetical protein
MLSDVSLESCPNEIISIDSHDVSPVVSIKIPATKKWHSKFTPKFFSSKSSVDRPGSPGISNLFTSLTSVTSDKTVKKAERARRASIDQAFVAKCTETLDSRIPQWAETGTQRFMSNQSKICEKTGFQLGGIVTYELDFNEGKFSGVKQTPNGKVMVTQGVVLDDKMMWREIDEAGVVSEYQCELDELHDAFRGSSVCSAGLEGLRFLMFRQPSM